VLSEIQVTQFISTVINQWCLSLIFFVFNIFIILFHFLTAEWLQHPETKEIAILQERHSESRRLRHQENEADELSTHLLVPPGKGHRDERPSSDGDDEQEGEESEVVCTNPFALLSDE